MNEGVRPQWRVIFNAQAANQIYRLIEAAFSEPIEPSSMVKNFFVARFNRAFENHNLAAWRSRHAEIFVRKSGFTGDSGLHADLFLDPGTEALIEMWASAKHQTSGEFIRTTIANDLASSTSDWPSQGDDVVKIEPLNVAPR